MGNNRFRETALIAVHGKRPWTALDLLPRSVSTADDGGSSLEYSTLADFAVVIECVQSLLERLVDDESPPIDIDGPGKRVWVAAHFDRVSTIPVLVALERLRDACTQTSQLIYSRWNEIRKTVGELDTSDVTALQLSGRTVRTRDLVSWLASRQVPTLEKLHHLQSIVNTLAVVVTWYLVDTAVMRWPSGIDAIAAVETCKIVGVGVTTLIANPQLVALTDKSTWSALEATLERTGAQYGATVRQQLSESKAPSRSQFVAVFDPTFAVTAAVTRLIVRWFDAVLKGSEDALHSSVDDYWSARGRALPMTYVEETGRAMYGDFVLPTNGDGAWPGSVAEIEYLVRRSLLERSAAQRESGGPLLDELDGKWYWVQPPWALPLTLAAAGQARDWHRRAPLLAWMMTASSNPFADQNVFSGFDNAVRALAETAESDARRKEVREIWQDMESVVLPASISAGAMAGIVGFIWPEVPTAMSAALGSATSPLIKLIRKRRSKSK